MISFLKKFKASQLKPKSYKLNAGMTYVELIVVLSIFATLSGVVMFNYNAFQGRIDIKNLSSDIALKITEAQKSSLAGRLPARTYNSTWRPAYGIYINPQSDNKSLIYFTDLNEDKDYTHSSSGCLSGDPECLEQISLTHGNTILSINVYYLGDANIYPLTDLNISFKRPSSSANITSTSIPTTGIPPVPTRPISYVEITVHSPKGYDAKIRVYPSGKIEIK